MPCKVQKSDGASAMVEHGLPACPPSVLRIPDQLSDLAKRGDAVARPGPVGGQWRGGQVLGSSSSFPNCNRNPHPPGRTGCVRAGPAIPNAIPPHPLPLSTRTPPPHSKGNNFQSLSLFPSLLHCLRELEICYPMLMIGVISDTANIIVSSTLFG